MYKYIDAWKPGAVILILILIHAFNTKESNVPAVTYNSPAVHLFSPYTLSSVKLYSGYAHTIGIKADSTVWVWGNNSQGQMGNGSNGNDVLYPFKVNGMNSVIDAAGGYEHTLVLKNNGTVWAWGRNTEGELGDGTLTQQTLPVAAGGLSSVVNVGAGYYNSYAVKADGTLWAWGYNNYGQLGNGTLFNNVAPTPVTGITGVVDVSGGDSYTIALKTNGTVWALGYNGYGQMGNGTTDGNAHTSPTQVSGLTNVVAISAGRYHAMALKTDGTVWAWGNNANGRLGNGNTNNQNTPIQVSGLSNVASIS